MKKLKPAAALCSFFLLAAVLFKSAPYFFPGPALLGGTGFSTAVYDRNGVLMRLTLAPDSSYRAYAPSGMISENLKKATVLYEDRWFYYHFGFNPVSLLRGAVSLAAGDKKPAGASTITMQLARIKYGINSKSVLGKLEQILKAVYLEMRYKKDDILEAYLNLAPYGHNIAGAEAASLIYFNSRAEKLSLAEALSLAVIPQNPSGRTPTKAAGMERMAEARSRLFAKWVEIYPEDSGFSALFNMPLSVQSPSDLPYMAPHFTDRLLLSGLRGNVRSSLDMKYQALLEKRTEAFIRRGRASGINNAAALLVDYKTMEIKAYVGSADYFNEGINGQVDGVSSKRSPGSVLKPFIYALAAEQGIIHPKSMLKDAPRRFGSYSPENADRGFMGPLFASDALVHSRNIPAIDLLNRLEKPSFYDFLKESGITGLKNSDFYGSALAVGGFEVTMLETAELYCALAGLGARRGIKFLKDGAAVERGRILGREASFLTLEMLSGNPRPRGAETDGAVYWKTGTSFAFKDAWSAGIFGDYVLVVWVGNFDGKGNPAFTGRGAAAPLFFSIVSGLASLDGRGFPRIMPSLSMNVKLVDICSPTGDLPGKFCPQTEKGWFIPGVSPIKVSDIYRQIPIDKKTGLRACRYDENTSYLAVYEFWPTDIYDLFLKSGVHKRRPPRYMPGCDIDDISYFGSAPVFSMPADGSVYTITAGSDRPGLIPFAVSADSGANKIYWFVNGRLVGSGKPSEKFFWRAKPGVFRLTVSDDAGRSSSVNFSVELAAGAGRGT